MLATWPFSARTCGWAVLSSTLSTSWFASFIMRCIIATATGPSGRTARIRELTPPRHHHRSPAGTRRRGFLCTEETMDFTKLDGLIPAVVQDHETQEVLMVGFMNAEAWEITKRTGYVTFYSRTRNKLWTKGETSGNRLAVREVFIDCDDDTVLVKAERLGDGNVCHTGDRTCFSKKAEGVTVP
jgi:phosphoribosyl-AMP cyclohydrolase